MWMNNFGCTFYENHENETLLYGKQSAQKNF